MPTSRAEVAARATTFHIASGTPSRGPDCVSFRRSTVKATDSPSGPLAENLTFCAVHGFAWTEANSTRACYAAKSLPERVRVRVPGRRSRPPTWTGVSSCTMPGSPVALSSPLLSK